MSNEIEEEMEVDDLLDSLDEMARLDGAKSSIDAMQIIEDDFAEKTNEDDGISEKTEIIENPAADTENIENSENSEDSENSEGEKTVTASFTDNENESSNHGSKKGGTGFARKACADSFAGQTDFSRNFYTADDFCA